MRAIETHYKGYRFRSRLEARWAVFFDALGLKWEYETEGYDLAGVGYYLPDFVIRFDVSGEERKTYIEIKGDTPTASEIEKLKALSAASGAVCNLFQGDPMRCQTFTAGPDPEPWLRTTDDAPGDLSELAWFAWGASGFQGDSSSWWHPVVAAACQARGARFEHGESGAWQR